MAWQFEPSALEPLRDQLLERGRVLEHRLAPSEVRGTTRPVEMPGSASVDTLLQRVAPFLELLYLMMVADGKCDERERQLLRGVTRTLGGADLSSAAVERLLTDFDAHLETEGAAGRLETVASLLCGDRLDAETAFTLTATMALADGDVDIPEHTVLAQLAEVLGLSAARARELAESRRAPAR